MTTVWHTVQMADGTWLQLVRTTGCVTPVLAIVAPIS